MKMLILVALLLSGCASNKVVELRQTNEDLKLINAALISGLEIDQRDQKGKKR